MLFNVKAIAIICGNINFPENLQPTVCMHPFSKGNSAVLKF